MCIQNSVADSFMERISCNLKDGETLKWWKIHNNSYSDQIKDEIRY